MLYGSSGRMRIIHDSLPTFSLVALLYFLTTSSFATTQSVVVEAFSSHTAVATTPSIQYRTRSLTHKTTVPHSRLYETSSSTDDHEASPPQTTTTTTPETTMMISPVLKFIGKTTSTVVSATFFIVLAWQRDALMVSFFIGAISNGILSKVLKKLIQQERPMEDYGSAASGTTSILEPPPPSDNGMPSSHAMSLGFIGTFTGFLLLDYHPYSSILLVLYASISLWYRIISKLHTWEQVAVGMTVGTVNAVVWRCLCFGTTQPFSATPVQDLPINVMEFVTNNLLNDQGVLPIYGLAVPALLGAVIVGSVERRIGRFLKLRKEEKEAASSSKQA
mmetsp:Transcript_32272/g.78502  ORF Transcript_32272/g.78502 Transcript_32272/m.78502 type:complete len:333 (+) Transcript_32272:45-1043(+)